LSPLPGRTDRRASDAATRELYAIDAEAFTFTVDAFPSGRLIV
jgi:hypothetical protein